MRFRLSALLLASVTLTPLAAAPPVKPAPLATIAEQVKLPYEAFTLANGLRVVVSTDRKAPVVAVSVWYHTGSKDEPAGKTGFAHLFEHLMFNGSENAPGDYFGPLEKVGATDYNGTTSFDRTNYFETVPTPALPLALFLESDRMGHLLGAVGQETLDRQRGVVQNEKRQDDNQPYGLVQYAEQQALFPDGHPYQHTTIGSMADLDGASLEDVRAWFRGHYGPNNAVLVLAGDIDAATARPLVEKYFGDIARGPQPAPTLATVPTLKARKDELLHDQVATTRLYREWTIPGLTDPDTVPLDIAASVLGGLASSRLDNILVRKEGMAVSVTASAQPLERVGEFEVTVDVRPGVDPVAVGKRLDAIIADLVANGPTADEIQRAVTQEVAGRLFGLEKVGGFNGRAAVLAQGAVYAGDPGFYEKQLAQYAAATPGSVKAVLQKWLSRPVYALTVAPGQRAPYEEAKATQADAAAPKPGVKAVAASGAVPTTGPARTPPPVGDIVTLTYPKIERSTLSNGIRLVYAQRAGLPLSRIALTFDAGYAADPKAAPGTEALMLSLLDEGTTTRTSADIAADQERLGSRIAAGASMDQAEIDLVSLTANLSPALDLLADVTLNPTFSELPRVKGEQLAAIQSEIADPSGLAGRTLPGLLYGPTHPYGVPSSGLGDPATVAKLGKADLSGFKARWLRPSNTTIFIVADQPLVAIQPLLESRFGQWKGQGPAGAKAVDAAIPAPKPRIVLLDRPGSPQSVIQAGEVLKAKGTDELLPLIAANDPLGGSFLSRLNMDIRETKAWSYGVQAGFSRYVGRIPYFVTAPVQTDKTGPSMQAMLADMHAFLTTQPLTQTERDRTVQRSIRQLPGSFETGSDLLDAMQRNDLLKRPDDYYAHIADAYRALTVDQLKSVAREQIRPDELLWVVVGDAAKVKPQLDALGLPVEVVKAPSVQ
jgi:predicted Zn-dependent peptidase